MPALCLQPGTDCTLFWQQPQHLWISPLLGTVDLQVCPRMKAFRCSGARSRPTLDWKLSVPWSRTLVWKLSVIRRPTLEWKLSSSHVVPKTMKLITAVISIGFSKWHKVCTVYFCGHNFIILQSYARVRREIQKDQTLKSFHPPKGGVSPSRHPSCTRSGDCSRIQGRPPECSWSSQVIKSSVGCVVDCFLIAVFSLTRSHHVEEHFPKVNFPGMNGRQSQSCIT